MNVIHEEKLFPGLLVTCFVSFLLAGCGDGGTTMGTSNAGTLQAGPLFPLQEGNSWTYKVTTPDEITMKTQVVQAQEPVGGTGPHAATMAFKLVTLKKSGQDETHSWQLNVGTRVVRYRELSFSAAGGLVELDEHWDPPKLRVDESAERVVGNATWLEMYRETKTPTGATSTTAEQRDSWKVVGVQSITVPAKTFDGALVVQKVSATTGNIKTYWFVPGVGKVKETGSDSQTEELASWQLAQ